MADLPLHGHHDALLHRVADDDAELFCFLAHNPVLAGALLPDHRLDPGKIAPDGFHLFGGFERAHGFLDPHPKQLIREIALPGRKLVGAEFAQLCSLHCTFSCEKRVENFVRIGSFAAASFKASRASASVTPSISKRTRPGRTTATHCSGAPLPLPMRVSWGFLVIGLSGKTRTQIFPPRLMNLVIATRAASIWRSVIQHGSIAFIP